LTYASKSCPKTEQLRYGMVGKSEGRPQVLHCRAARSK
jgi:hypothetical protein